MKGSEWKRIEMLNQAHLGGFVCGIIVKGLIMKVESILDVIEKENIDYGTVWSEAKLMEVFNIELPDVSSRKANTIVANVKKFELAKMNASACINEQLINFGMCFIQDKGVYRVPVISEMTNQMNKYYKSSNRKFKRAEKLRKSFSALHPVVAKEINDKAVRTATSRSSSKPYQPLA